MTDLARGRAATGARTWFVEEPMTGDVDEPRLEHEERDGVTRIWLVVPAGERAAEVHLGFAADGSEQYGSLVADLIAKQGRSPAPDVWLYTPMALDVAAPQDMANAQRRRRPLPSSAGEISQHDQSGHRIGLLCGL